MAVHQVLEDGRGVAAFGQMRLDELTVRFAGAGRGAPAGPRFRRDHCPPGRVRAKVGGHLYGRFCFLAAPTTRRSHGDARRSQIPRRRFAPNVRGLLDTPQRPPQLPQRDNLLFLLFAQDIAHVTEAPFRQASMSGPLLSPLAAFQVSLNGRFWVSPEGGCSLAATSIACTVLAGSLSSAARVRTVQRL